MNQEVERIMTAAATVLVHEEDPVQALPLEEQIRLRAYELYEARGCRPGLALDDWLQAEQEILSDLQQTDNN